jgi:hypothetical protein
MVSLKWGDVLSAVLPGAVGVLAIAPWIPSVWSLIIEFNRLEWTTGVAFLFAAAIVGGVLEGLTRISWEKWISKRRPLPSGVLASLTPENLPLYERSVDTSYKYVTFYANLAWALLGLGITVAAKWPHARYRTSGLLIVVVGILLRASFVQWTYFVNYQTQVFGGRIDAGKRSATGNAALPRKATTEGDQDAGGVRNGDAQQTGRVPSGKP